MRNKNGIFCMAGGLALLLAALCLTGYNLWDDSRAASHCRDVFLEYTGNKGWDDGAKWLAEKFYPGAEKDEWVFD